jgi:flagellar basal body P-ring protein FlgI
VEKYLNSDYRGAASNILYGRKGDKVTVLNEKHGMVLVENNSILFHVKAIQLSDKPIEVPVSDEKIKSKPVPVQSSRTVKKKIQGKPTKQTDLF